MATIDKLKIETALREANDKLRKNSNRPMSEACIEARACIDCFKFVLSCLHEPPNKMTVHEFFDKHPVTTLGISQISGIGYTQMRQYACSYKSLSQKRVGVIEKAIHALGRELLQVKLIKPL